MERIFAGCSSLVSLPNISKWNTKNIIYMGFAFSNCVSLSSIPDISIWNTDSIILVHYMFYDCLSLTLIPEEYSYEKSLRRENW